MNRFTIAYDLHSVADSSVYQKIKDDVAKKFSISKYVLNTTVLISTNDNVNTVSAGFKGILDKYIHNSNHYEYIVVPVKDSLDGWLTTAKWDWIKTYFKQFISSYR